MKRRRPRNTSLERKGARLKREAKGTLEEGLSFLPGYGFARTTYNTTRRAVRTAEAANDYFNELHKVARRKARKYNPFN